MNIVGVLFEGLICLILFEYLRKYLGGEFFGKKLMQVILYMFGYYIWFGGCFVFKFYLLK